ncbi:SOS response-associated peptidase family protein [Rhizobium populisoli]|uniref:SOS response-associated peptidase family protein n=1 Tax=Rhizobium populisoli TaxID=2859785 RepID=UPI0035E43D2F
MTTWLASAETPGGSPFAGMTGEANDLVRPLNNRMPVILKPDDYERWLHGGIDEVIKFQLRETISSGDFSMLETMDRWQSGIPPARSIPRKSSRSML